MIFLSAGHNTKKDPGAVANGFNEAELTRLLRDAIANELKALGASYRTDNDDETLVQYLSRISTGTGSVVCDLHFNAGVPNANGIECYIADSNSEELAREICIAGELIRLNNRGVKRESQSQHKRLAILHDGAKIAVLVEVCFITSKSDLDKYFDGFECFAKSIATLLYKWDKKFS
jgi:N-acetylmuramoyl-L-alanine amidase